MRFVPLGTTGVRVSELCLGTMMFGKQTDEADAQVILDRAWDAGINFFDTANIYAQGESERIVGRWMGGKRRDLVLATKVHSPMGGGPNDWGSSRRNIMLAAEDCLRRLQTEWIDILYLHQWDGQAALEDSLGALTTLVAQGKVLYVGVSNFAAWQTMKAMACSSARHFAPIAVTQPMYSLIKRQAEVEILPQAADSGLAVCPYSPIGAGLLTGKYQRGETGRIAENDMYRRRYADTAYAEVAERFVAYAKEHGHHPAALAVAWVGSHPQVTAPILGPRTLDQFEESLGCVDIALSPDQRAEISALSFEPPLATDRERC